MLTKIKLGLALAATIICTSSFASQIDKDAELAEGLLKSTHSSLQQLYNYDMISFSSAENEVTFVKSLMDLQTALALVTKIKESNPSKSRLEKKIEEARLLKKIMTAYLGDENILGFFLKLTPVTVEIDSISAFERINKRLPFLGKPIDGVITINPNGEATNQFNSLRLDFYRILVDAADLNRAESRIKVFALWGNQTKVIYPSENFGKKIISDRDFRALNLP